MHQLRELIGREHEIDWQNRALRDFAQSVRATAVGGLHGTCSDESEREAVESFQHWFADSLLPELKFWSRSPFRLANLGGRYEWGAIAIAEQHFATPETRDGFKLLVVKLNSHVSVTGAHGHPQFGSMDRYASPSVFCGALHGLLADWQGPAFDQLREAFSSEGKPRLETLKDANVVDPTARGLLVAVVNARLQARLAIVDIQNYRPLTPTLYLVLPCVTLNKKQRDSELVVGFYLADHRGSDVTVQYWGLEDDPGNYRLSLDHGRIQIGDERIHHPREARDHRDEILTVWQQRRMQEETVRDERVARLVGQAAKANGSDPKLTYELLKTLGWLMLDLSPVPTSVLLFAKGVAGAHHLYRVHRLARGERDEQGARKIVDEFVASVDRLPPEKAREVMNVLLEQHPLLAGYAGKA